MSMTDPIADMLTRVRNANVAMKDTVRMPSSKMKEALATLLKREGYIEDFSIEADAKQPARKYLSIKMKYSTDRKRTISGIQRISKPGLRVYRQASTMPRVYGGLGVAVVSTSKGLITDAEARKAGVGGEVVAYVW
jgi:small subunit ribosomal protein S8